MAFNGMALFDTGVFTTTQEDVSDIVSMVSPFETPLLDALTPPERPATNILHEWLEEDLRPNTIVFASALASTAADTGTEVASAAARYLKPGSILENESTLEKIVVITLNAPNSLTVARAFAGTSATSYDTAQSWAHIADAGQEGDDVNLDVSRPRVRKFNRVQLFKVDVIVSGTMQAVNKFGVADEFDHQVQNRTREILRNLEKTFIRGVSSDANSLGGEAAGEYRTMDGLWARITTNATSNATLTESLVGNVLQNAWDNGGTDIDLMVCDILTKRKIDAWNNTRVRVTNDETTYRNKITEYDSAFGVQNVLISRWCRPNTLMCISSNRCKATPLQNRSFRFEEVSKTGDARKGFLVGEYTAEVRNEAAMSKWQG